MPRSRRGLVVIVLALAASPSRADESTKDIADMDLEELVKVRVSPFEVSTRQDEGYRASNSVSGSRFDSPIRVLPFAIQAFTESFIRDQRPVTLFDVAKYSPGVTYRSNDFNEGNANLAIRGFAVSSVAGNTQVLRDGFHGPSIFDFTNISRVEVVKGPASFLYGQVAPGGIVNIITKSPRRKFGATADVTWGSYDQYRFAGDVTGPATEALSYRLAASYDQDSHYWKPYDGHSWVIAPSIRFQPIDQLSITIKYERFDKLETPQLMQKPGYNAQSGVIPTESDPNLSGVDVPGLPDTWNSMSFADRRHSETSSLSAWIDFQANDHWNLRVGYSHQDYVIDALFSGNLGMANNTTLLQGRRVRRQTYTNRDDTVEAQGVGQYQFEHASLHVLLGAQYIDRSFANSAGQAPNDPALGDDPTASPLPLWDLSDPTTWDRDATVPMRSLTSAPADASAAYSDRSVYGGTTLGLFDDRLLVLAGWRLTSTESQVTNNVAQRTEPKVMTTMVTPQYGLLFKITPGLSAFASYSESFVPGVQLLNNPDGTTSAAAPTQGRGFDLGLKADLLQGRVSSTVTFFGIYNRNIVNDLAHTDSTGAVQIFNVQSGEQRSLGVELDGTLTLTPEWQLCFSYSFMDARITEFSGDDAAILALDPDTLDAAGQANYRNVRRFHGAPLQMSAPHLANLWTRYRFAQGSLRGVSVAGGVNFVYDQALLPDGPASSHQTYALINASLGYHWQWSGHQVGLDVTGKNLADMRYRPSQSTRGRPREFLLTLRARF